MSLEDKRTNLFQLILFMSLEDKRDNLFQLILFMSYDVIQEIIYSPPEIMRFPPPPPQNPGTSLKSFVSPKTW